MLRRDFLVGAAAMAAAPVSAPPLFAQGAPIPVIDTHVHIFDPRRPQGVPYSGPRGQPPRSPLPENYHQQIVGPASSAR